MRFRGRRSMHITRNLILGAAAALVASASFAAPPSKDEVKRLNEATTILSEIRGASDNGIPGQIWNKAECVVVIPSLKKAGFIIGGEFGSIVMSCRRAGQWGAPVFMELAKGSGGFQI